MGSRCEYGIDGFGGNKCVMGIGILYVFVFDTYFTILGWWYHGIIKRKSHWVNFRNCFVGGWY